MIFKCCLKSSYSLRTQLLLSFGVSAFISISVVVILACVAVFVAGRVVNSHADDLMRGQVTRTLFVSSKLVADKFNAYMVDLEGTVQLMVEGVQDRIVGYPEPGWEGDAYVPFVDMLSDSRTRKYPLNMAPPPLDWNISNFAQKSTAQEHIQERYINVSSGYLQQATFASASYFFQGACDPNETEASSHLFYPGCSDAHNDVTTGGVVQPTVDNYHLWRKSGDLQVFMKPLYEAQMDALYVTVAFFNNGAGSLLYFPGHHMYGASQPYESQGCDWMRETNPHTGKPYAGEDAIARCHPAGTLVSQREFNPMEQEWCQLFALSDRMQWYGPFFSLSIDEPVMMVGKGVFDRLTGAFIGCVAVTIELATLSDVLDASLLTESSVLSLVRFDSGQVINDSLNSVIKQRNTSLLVADTNVIHVESFKAFQQAVNYSNAWTPKLLDETYQNLAIQCKMGITTAYPLPLPPEEYDPSYVPEFFVLNIIGDQVFDVVNEIEASISSDVDRIGKIIVGLGLFGMILVLLIVWCVSRMLTQPLMWMEATAYRIINHADDLIEPEAPATMHCSPKSEVDDLVAEFRCMIQNFSGSGAATVAESALQEVRNELTWHSDFQHLYSRRGSFRCNGGSKGIASNVNGSPRNSGTKTNVTGELTDEESNGGSGQGTTQQQIQALPPFEDGAEMIEQLRCPVLHQPFPKSKLESKHLIVPAPIKQNRNHVINVAAVDSSKASWASCVEGQPIKYHRSRLFWLIVVLIVIPLLLTNAVICSIVSTDIVTTIPGWVDEAGASSYLLEEEALNITASSKAALVKALVYESVRDLHLVNRIAGWLFFDAIIRSDTFTDMDSASEECKVFSFDTCPFYFNSTRVPCPCEWEDLNGKQCTNVSNTTVARDLQRLFFGVQSLDADVNTGFRNSSPSFPRLGSLPNTTQWWHLVEDLPGNWKGSNASGFATSYDRARVSSAISIAESPVYNYRTSMHRPLTTIALYLAFEDDGMFTGFTGCAYTHGNFPFWNSTHENGAYKIAPNLCPFGKYGYDPRCRGWYATGKSNYDSNQTPVHITAPYLFALQGSVATSATSPLANPETGEYAGQVLLDFLQTGIRNALSHVDTGNLSILITPVVEETIGDTVVGPNKSAGWESANITDLLFLHEKGGSTNPATFERNVLAAMKNGSSGMMQFKRLKDDSQVETLIMAFAPIHERVLLPLNPSDFSRGVNVTNVLLYSVGIAVDVDAMHEPFRSVEYDINCQLAKLRYGYIGGTILVSLLFTACTCIVTLYVTKPLITLLRAVKNINNRTIDDDFPPLLEGSREVHRVYSTFAKLYKVVRISNTAFFSNKLKSASRTITNALALFRKVEDRKAIGIACNNLGNTLFAMYYYDKEGSLEDEEHSCCTCVSCMALPCYNEAIDIAQKDFDGVPESLAKADYALQLSDRMFSRGLFLLVIENESCAPHHSREQAYRDIQQARNLDYDVKDYWLEHKVLLANSATYFSRLIRRINGLAEFWDDTGLREIWDVKELINDADQLLFAAWNEPNAPLFREVTRVGRLQQLEAAAIQLWHRMGNDFEAARLGMRMLSEDEYLLDGPFVRAAEALLRVVRDDESHLSLSKKTISSTRQDLRRMLKGCKNVSLDIGKNVVFTMELSERWEGDPVLEKINEQCMKLYDRFCMPNDYIGIVAYSTKESLTVELGTKEENLGRQRTLLDIATTSTTERANPAFPLAVQMVVDSQASLDNDSFIILCMDGYAWDSDAASSIQTQIERLNCERNTFVHVFVIGLDVEDDMAREQCRRLCTVSKLSVYADGATDNLDGIFDVIASTLSGRPTSSGFQMGITMEKF